MKVYVFMIRRPADVKMFPNGWPALYHSSELADKAFGRVTPVIEVEIPIPPPVAPPRRCGCIGGADCALCY